MQARKDPPHDRVLIVDDMPDSLTLLEEIVSGCGYRVATSGSGEEALEAVAEQPPDLILLDLLLPGIDGYEVCRRIKADPSTRDIPVILLSALHDVQDKVKGFRAGAVDYIQKPWRTEEMMVRLETHLARGRLQHELERQNIRLQREIGERRKAQEAVERHHGELMRSNGQLRAFYQVSRALSRSIELDLLLPEVLKALREVVAADLRGAIFLVEDGKLHLTTFISLTELDLRPCREISFGTCLCGKAAETGEILFSQDSSTDERHEIASPKLGRHGHIVLPLKVRNKVIGVLNLYTRQGASISPGARRFLSSIGYQIGNAVNNARRFEESRKLSFHDPLTGLANRRSLEAQQDLLLENVHRYGDHLSLIMLDIDYFKRFNDLHGHLEGDRALVRTAGILRRESRHVDHVFRFGGEEFLVVMPRIDAQNALLAAERLRRAAEAEAEVTLSLGVASWEKGLDMEGLIRKADAALYEAKQQGRNRVAVSPPSMNGAAIKMGS